MEVLAVPATNGATDRALGAIAIRFASKLQDLAMRSGARQREEVDGLKSLMTPALWEENLRLHRESRAEQANHLTRDGELPQACPRPDRDAARLALHGGLSPLGLLHCYRIAHECSIDAWLHAVAELNLTAVERAECAAAVSRFVAAYDGRLANLLLATYEQEQERARLSVSADGTRLTLVRELLEGSSEAARQLDYPLALHHIGVVASGSHPQQALAEVARFTGQRYLVAWAEDGLAIGWLGRQRNGASSGRLIRGFEAPAGVTLAFGTVRSGHAGLRRTHREASDAHQVACLRQQSIVVYDDVLLEVLALANRGAARTFVEDALGPLDTIGERPRLLRETLSSYFSLGQNALSTAAALGVSDKTVRKRRTEIERRIGRPLNQCHAELEAALRLRSLLPPEGEA